MLKHRYLLSLESAISFSLLSWMQLCHHLTILMMTPGLSPCLFEQQTYIDQRE
ncbi:hypothetical protein HMPREF1015_01068 [Bacillus smithii 7_3_47FAA]|uniref:Uncharacterized protein n=1 Tax=Bacillus smithii 7_3_47FAA TaxID=665952 RepID=G9QH09_9BACI|nr:hypothetical protein HMPREF1015_01068 [Bacillus smithii 7_3_47FAA]